MKYRVKKFIALLMALLMVLNMTPISAIADITDEGNTKRGLGASGTASGNNLILNLNSAGLELTTDEAYFAYITVQYNNNTIYALAPLVVSKGDTSVTIPIQWYDQNDNPINDVTLNDLVIPNITYYSTYVNNNQSTNARTPKALRDAYSSSYTVLKLGNDLEGYKAETGATTQDEEGHINFNISLTANTAGISKAEIWNAVETARNYGVFTNLWSHMGPDMESTIAAAVVKATGEGTYGYQHRNINTNKLVVTKNWSDKSQHDPVTIVLHKKDGTVVASKELVTDGHGAGNVEFDALPTGDYYLEEIIGNKSYFSNVHYLPHENTDHVKFDDSEIKLINFDEPYNYIGSVYNDSVYEFLIEKCQPNTYFVTPDANVKAKFESFTKFQERGLKVFTTSEINYPVINFSSEMSTLEALSRKLAKATSSKTVEVMLLLLRRALVLIML